MQQALLFAALLALARAYRDGDRFFAPVAAVLLGSLMFVRLDSLVVLGAVGAGLLLLVADGTRLGLGVPRASGGAARRGGRLLRRAHAAYLAIPHDADGRRAGTVGRAGGAGRRRRRDPPRTRRARRRWSEACSAGCRACSPWRSWRLAAYAYFLREPAGRLAVHDAYALRAFGWYVGPVGLLAAVAGFVALAWTRFWKDPVLLTDGRARRPRSSSTRSASSPSTSGRPGAICPSSCRSPA